VIGVSEEVALQTGAMGAEEEARSVLGTAIAQLVTLIRNIVNYLMTYMGRFYAWISEHPLAGILFIANMCVLIS